MAKKAASLNPQPPLESDSPYAGAEQWPIIASVSCETDGQQNQRDRSYRLQRHQTQQEIREVPRAIRLTRQRVRNLTEHLQRKRKENSLTRLYNAQFLPYMQHLNPRERNNHDRFFFVKHDGTIPHRIRPCHRIRCGPDHPFVKKQGRRKESACIGEKTRQKRVTITS